MVKVIVAEDNPRDRQFLADVLGDYYIIETVNGAEALVAALEQDAPWVVSDLQMPGMNGIDLARSLWREKPAARIVFWSHHRDEIYVRSLASIVPPETVYGFILKDNAADVLQRGIAAVFREGQCWIDPKVRPVQARASQRHSALTDVEYDVLIDIALGLTDNMIARRHYLSRRGAQSRLKSLYRKLGIDQEYTGDKDRHVEVYNLRTRAVAVALDRGLINAFELKDEEQKLRSWLKS